MTLNELVYDLIESVVGTPTDDEEIYGKFISAVKQKLVEFIEATENKPSTVAWRSVQGEWDLQKCNNCEGFYIPMDMRNNCTCEDCYDEDSAW